MRRHVQITYLDQMPLFRLLNRRLSEAAVLRVTGALFSSVAIQKPMDLLYQSIDNSFVRETVEDTSSAPPNRTPREVLGAHRVHIESLALKKPYLITSSPAFLEHELCLPASVADDEQFLRLFSADQSVNKAIQPWATPYALSIYGQMIPAPDPMTAGNGYGDGRAASFAELVTPLHPLSLERSTAGLPPSAFTADSELSPIPDLKFAGTPQFATARYVGCLKSAFADAVPSTAAAPSGPDTLTAAAPTDGPGNAPPTPAQLTRRWELQWKGGGPTPFCRGADGRAVVRSSIREFLASEFMAACGIPTTRAVATIGSPIDKAVRPWYYAGRERQGDEPCAITTRAAPSFIRIGHIELFARRVRGMLPKSEPEVATKRLHALVRHAIRREFPQLAAVAGLTEPPADAANPDPLPVSTLIQFLDHSGAAICDMVGGWMNVGYVQSNFNSDNCLVGGRTMDYGPFGYVDAFSPTWIMWTGGGDKFSFFSQPQAALRNFKTLNESVAAIIPQSDWNQLNGCLERFADNIGNVVDAVWRRKLGFPPEGAAPTADTVWEKEGRDVCQAWLRLLDSNDGDWAMAWRRLATVAETAGATDGAGGLPEGGAAPAVDALGGVWYADMGADANASVAEWAASYVATLRKAYAEQADFGKVAAAQMRAVSPKYIPREHLLRDVYTAAVGGDFAPLKRLQAVLTQPFAEGTAAEAEAFDVKTPQEIRQSAGVCYMSCSS